MTFEIDTAGNAKLDALLGETTKEHDLWLVENGQPVAAGQYPKDMKGFIPVSKYLPIMHDNNDNFGSTTCLVLTQSKQTKEYDITSGFVMKFKDGTDIFWYNHDAINNVVGFMPMPETKMGTHSKNSRIGFWG